MNNYSITQLLFPLYYYSCSSCSYSSFFCCSGVPVGKKGPLIQIGSIIAAVVSQGKNAAFGFDISWTKFLDFRNDRQKVLLPP